MKNKKYIPVLLLQRPPSSDASKQSSLSLHTFSTSIHFLWSWHKNFLFPTKHCAGSIKRRSKKKKTFCKKCHNTNILYFLYRNEFRPNRLRNRLFRHISTFLRCTVSFCTNNLQYRMSKIYGILVKVTKQVQNLWKTSYSKLFYTFSLHFSMSSSLPSSQSAVPSQCQNCGIQAPLEHLNSPSVQGFLPVF